MTSFTARSAGAHRLHRSGRATRRRHPLVSGTRRRGIAMLLVLVSLATATVLAASYLAARDNSASIGENIAAAAEARWASLAGVDLAVGILETETDWRTNHVGGVLLDDHPVGGALVDVVIEDRVTEAPPNEKTTDVVIRSTATAGAVSQSATAYATIMPDAATQAVSLDLREFALFASESIVLRDDAAIGRWTTSRETKLAKPVNLGTLATDAGAVQTTGSARATDVVVWSPSSASSFLVSDGSDARIAKQAMPDERIPVPDSPAPSYEPVGLPEIADATWSGNHILLGLELWEDVVHAGAFDVATVQDSTLVVDDRMSLDGVRMRVAHALEMVVYGDLALDNATIVVEPGGELDLYVGGAFTMRDSMIAPGDAGGNITKVLDGTGNYADPGVVRIWSVDRDASADTWTIDGTSMVIGIVHAPDTDVVRMADDAAAYGRVTAPSIELDGRSALWYDPALDDGFGYTNPDSMLYDDDGLLRDVVLTVNDLSDAELQAIADATGIKVTNITDEVLEKLAAVDDDVLDKLLGGGDKDDPAPPAAATPRPIPVSVTLVENGGHVADWENRR